MKLSIRILVKLSLIVIVLLGSFSMAQAQKLKKIYNRPHCKVFLKNGKVVDSYLMAGHNLIHRTDSAIKLSNNPNARIIIKASDPYGNTYTASSDEVTTEPFANYAHYYEQENKEPVSQAR